MGDCVNEPDRCLQFAIAWFTSLYPDRELLPCLLAFADKLNQTGTFQVHDSKSSQFFSAGFAEAPTVLYLIRIEELPKAH